MPEESITRVFQIMPATVDMGTHEITREANPNELTAYFLDSSDPIKTDVESGGKKYVLTITIEPV